MAPRAASAAPAADRLPIKRLSWAVVVATGGNVRQVQPGDRVLFDPEDRHEVELQSKGYILLREKDIHAVAASRVDDGNTGLYL